MPGREVEVLGFAGHPVHMFPPERDVIEQGLFGHAEIGFGMFGTNAALLEQLRGDLNQIQIELVDQAAVGFPLGVILDVLPSSDAAIFRALADLVESGILASQPPAAP